MAQRAHPRRRPVQFRIAATLLLVVFLLAGVREGVAGYVCFQHSGHDHASHAFAAGGDAHSHHDSTANGQGSLHGASTAANDDAASTDHGENDPCSCIGDCRTGENSASPNVEFSPSATIALATSSDAGPAAFFLPGPPEFLLPYPNGPPSLG